VYSVEKRSLVIIDDHDLLRRGLISALGESWTVAGQAADLDEASSIFTKLKTPPDLVVLDIALGKGPWGLDLIPALAEQYGSRTPPVLVYSAYADYAHVQAAMNMGVRGYVSKAEGFPVLEKAMETVVQGQVYINQELISKLSAMPDILGSLTKREKQIFLAIQHGRDNQHIAEEFSLALQTVECYVNRIYSKLGVKSRKELQEL
jgi:NarL family two-component system response regulator LiaR